eukprot:Unigene8997_Nuclearia_a/m.27535 Unigene8997_Nuclearia_a/g.27535  ORF Unigene8997_Nuclearia_a/g.27535 Unigene8997_Nuclearia_a/m.27535 type:complete len:125 (+) Unigene8997_Nuclearia_a:1535-1909(+)
MQGLIRELGHRGRALAAANALSNFQNTVATSDHARAPGLRRSAIEEWTSAQVTEWLVRTARVGEDVVSQHFGTMTGVALLELAAIAKTSPQFAFEGLLPRLGVTELADQLVLSAHLRKLLSSAA